MNVLCLGSWLGSWLYINMTIQNKMEVLCLDCGLFTSLFRTWLFVFPWEQVSIHKHVCVDFMKHLVTLKTVTPLRLKCCFGQPSQRPVSSTTRTHLKRTAIAPKIRLYQKEFLVKTQVGRDVTLRCWARFARFFKRQQIRHSSWTAWTWKQK